MAFLDVTRAKLHGKGIHPRIWHLLVNWYSRSSSCFLLKGEHSRVFRIQQGFRQGAILSPLLYSVFVDDLLAQLDDCGLGAMIGSVHALSCMQMTSHLSLILMTTCSDIVSD